MPKDSSTIRITDIAKMAGVSVGTVDRVIHQRGHVSEENLQKVQAILEVVDYQPNLIARSLASKKQYRIVAITPSFAPGQYWDVMSQGIDKAARESEQYNIHIEKLFFDQYNVESFDNVIAPLFHENIDGVLVATLFTESIIRFSGMLSTKGIPYVYIDSDIPGENQLAYFGTDSFDGGLIAAKLLCEKIRPSSDILLAQIIHKGRNDSNQGKNRRKGFTEYLSNTDFSGEIHQVELKAEDTVYNFTALDQVFCQFPNIEGAVIFNSKCYILGNYIKARNMRNIKLLGYDLIEKNIHQLTDGIITTLIGQRPDAQGYQGIKSICDYLIFKKIPDKVNLMPLDILIKENIKYYLNNQ